MRFKHHNENEDFNVKSLDMTSLLDKRDDERFIRLTRLARKLFNVPVALISVMDRDCQRLLFWKGLNAPDNRSSISFCEHAISNSGPFVVNDALQDVRFHDNPLVTGPVAALENFYAEHFIKKGQEAARAVLAIHNLSID
ncbi:hypothetical protein [Cronobacter dublinensis]|uniref:hypothetical protein n=1 Tax=Cronobacter dublinensis TaxID=413497 RepID=UPI003AB92EA0